MILPGDLFDVLPTLDAESFASCVTDPPYGIGFMGREWDTFNPAKARASKAFAIGHGDKGRKDAINPNLRGRRQSPAISPSQIEYNRSLEGQRGFQDWTERWAREVFRVLKPGAHLVVCGAPRSHHRMMCGLEDAGFEVRDCLAWLFLQGFPKSKNLGAGWGTALKPGHEPICLARKPFKGTTQSCHDTHGTAGLNIDGCRIETDERAGPRDQPERRTDSRAFPTKGGGTGSGATSDFGRWPANVLLDEEAAELLDQQSGHLQSGDAHVLRRGGTTGRGMGYGSSSAGNVTGVTYGDSGGASRCFYVAKPSREERDLGCDVLAERSAGASTDRKDGSAGLNSPRAGAGRTGGGRNFHPTVKPLALMRWLVRLVTPVGGRVLEPFGGSGTTAMACAAEGFAFTLIEREAEYIPIIEARVRAIAPLFTESA